MSRSKLSQYFFRTDAKSFQLGVLFFFLSFSYLLQEASGGRPRVLGRSNASTEARKRDSGVVGHGLCTAVPPSAANIRVTSQTASVLLTPEDKYSQEA